MPAHGGAVAPSGELTLRVHRQPPLEIPTMRRILWDALPRPGLSRKIFWWRCRNLPNILRGLRKVAIARLFKIPHFYGQLRLTVFRGAGGVEEYGIASLRVVTTAGVNFIVDAFQNTTEIDLFKFHGFGTGSTAEAVGDTALVTELTTEYQTDNTRPTGSQTENGANVYRTVATLDPDADVNLREHGIFSATSAGTLLDRSVYASINLVGAAGDTLQATYDFTVTAGS